MPISPTYPGVYIEEVPSGVRSIVGAATSITAFVGRASKGPLNTPLVLNGFADFERGFGGLWDDSALGFAVYDFFQNGGGQAIVVRLFNPEAPPAPGGGAPGGGAPPPAPLTVADATTQLKIGDPGLVLWAKSPGRWGRDLRASVLPASPQAAAALGLPVDEVFTLKVSGPNGASETFTNVTVNKDSARLLERVLDTESSLIKWTWTEGAKNPDTKALATAIADLAKAKTADEIKAAQKKLDDEQGKLSDPVSALELVRARKKQENPLADTKADDEAISKEIAKLKGSDGSELQSTHLLGSEANKEGIYALEHTDLFNILCIPPYKGGRTGDVDAQVIATAAAYCERRRAFYLVDAPSTWKDKAAARAGLDQLGTRSKNAAIYFPRLRRPNPLRGNVVEDFAASGALAGLFARTDGSRGVWKAPAGIEATLVGAPALSVNLTDPENGELNQLGINCLRSMVPGRVSWGARTLQGDDRLVSEWKYVPVRRTALFLEESLYRGTQWVVFEPNDEPLWAQIRLNVGAFMQTLFRQGAFQGKTPREAYFVECGPNTTTQAHIDLGIVNIHVGFAPLKPAEFVIIRIQQIAGEIPV